MKLVTRRHRVFAILFGIALLVTVVVQILQDARSQEMKNATNFELNKK
jgi:hypothetical protein